MWKDKKAVVIEPSRSGGGYRVLLEMIDGHIQGVF